MPLAGNEEEFDFLKKNKKQLYRGTKNMPSKGNKCSVKVF